MSYRGSLNRRIVWALVLAVGLSAAYHADLVGRVAYAFERGRLQADADHLQAISADDVASLENISRAFSIIVRAVQPSVVNIRSFQMDSSFQREMERLFGEDFEGHPPLSAGTGSGVVIDRNGLILTNNHVVGKADSIRVTLSDGRQFTAERVGVDPKTDLAVIRIPADDLHPARFGNSDRVQPGHLVLAIGSPFRLEQSVSHGIVSALGRADIDVGVDYQNWIQTDASINPGNSGGPLINTRGEVVGINTAIATETGGHQGVGFAIPSNTAVQIARFLKEGRKVVRGYLGVGIKPVDHKVASAYGLSEPGGVFIEAVGPGTPADKAGLRPEDIVLAVDDKSVETREALQHLIASISPGTTITLTVWRDGKQIELPTVIEAQPSDFSTTGTLRDLVPRRPKSEDTPAKDDKPRDRRVPTSDRSAEAFPRIGMKVETLTPAAARKLEAPADVERGAIVTDVDVMSEAYYTGLRSGDIILTANGRPISTAADLENVFTREALERGVRLKVRSGRRTFFTVLQIPG